MAVVGMSEQSLGNGGRKPLVAGISFHLALMALAAGISANFQLGYLSSVLAQPYQQIEDYINSSLLERSSDATAPSKQAIKLINSALNISNVIAGTIGQLMALFICDRFGRRRAALIGCLFMFPGILLSLVTKWLHPVFETLIVGRSLWSLANGLLSVVQVIWLVESAPAARRGVICAVQELLGCLGALAAQGFGAPLSTPTLWPLIFVCPLVVNVACTIMFYFTHDSQEYLLIHKRAVQPARRAIAAYYGTNDSTVIDEQLLACERNGQSKAELAARKDINAIDVIFCPWKTADQASVILRRGAWIGLMVKIAYIFTGARAIRAFSTAILEQLGGWTNTEARYYDLIIGVARFPFTIIPVIFIDRLGRRPLLLGSGGMSALFLSALMACTMLGADYKIGTLLACFGLFTVNFSIGLGSVSRFYAAELVPRQLLLNSVTVMAVFEAAIKVAVEYSFYPLMPTFKSYLFLMFILPSLLFFFVMWRYCPETKGTYVNDVLNKMAEQTGVEVRFHESPATNTIEPTTAEAPPPPFQASKICSCTAAFSALM